MKENGGDELHSLGPLYEGLPIWVKVVLLFGLPTCMVLFFMGQDARIVPSLHRDIYEMAVQQEKELQAHRQRQEDLVKYLNNALAIICENQATNAQQTNNCKAIRY